MDTVEHKIMVKFKVTDILDKRNFGSSLEIGKVFKGYRDAKRKDIVWWEDPANGQEWVFYEGISCEIIN